LVVASGRHHLPYCVFAGLIGHLREFMALLWIGGCTQSRHDIVGKA